MILKPDKVIYSLIVIFLVFSLLSSIITYKAFQKNNLKYWEQYIKNFSQEKNKMLLLTFFSESGRIIDINNLNYYYLNTLISEDKSFLELKLAGMFLVTVNNVTIFSLDLDRDRNFKDVPKNLINDKIKDSLILNDITVKHFTNNGSNFSLVISPFYNSHYEHKYNIVYVYNNDYIYEKSLPFKTTFLVSFGLFFVFLLIMKIIQFTYAGYINNISKFINKDVLLKNDVNPYKLSYNKPFDSLETSITYLSAQKRELENKYFEVSERFHYLISLTGEGLIMEDEEGFIYFCNNRFAQILDYADESELIGKKFIDLIYDTKSIESYENETKFRNYKPQTTYSISLITKKGFKKECLLTGSLIRNSANNVIGYYGAITDISSLNSFNQDEMELVRLKAEAINQLQNPVVILDRHDIVYDLNDAFVSYIRLKKSDILGIEFSKLIKNFEIENIWENISKVANSSFELFEPSLNRWYFVIVKKINFNNQPYQLIYFINTTTIRRYEMFHKFILDEIKGFFFITNFKNKLIYLSPSFTNITGNPESWFENYFNSLVNLSDNKKFNFSDTMVISHFKSRFEFNVIQLQTTSESMKLYMAILK